MAGVIPSRAEILKDLVKWAAGEYGLDLAEAAWEKLDTPALVAMWKKRKASRGSGGFGVGVLVLAAIALNDTKKKRRR